MGRLLVGVRGLGLWGVWGGSGLGVRVVGAGLVVGGQVRTPHTTVTYTCTATATATVQLTVSASAPVLPENFYPMR
ncbi:hypothetical protein B484DRAFT_205767 [Ochromonadaceae sp. CCMP2298]|nr:hypothetical protein B484DRAFT_205767 [Ochromonadaceae sp. CCMP2298]